MALILQVQTEAESADVLEVDTRIYHFHPLSTAFLGMNPHVWWGVTHNLFPMFVYLCAYLLAFMYVRDIVSWEFALPPCIFVEDIYYCYNVTFKSVHPAKTVGTTISK